MRSPVMAHTIHARVAPSNRKEYEKRIEKGSIEFCGVFEVSHLSLGCEGVMGRFLGMLEKR